MRHKRKTATKELFIKRHITSDIIVWPVVRRSKKVLILNIYEVLGHTDGFDISHLNAYIDSNTLPPNKMLHHIQRYPGRLHAMNQDLLFE
jgi:hypothetical protein